MTINKMGYVIIDVDGNYIAPKQTDLGWYYLTYTGLATGFVHYSNKETAMYEMHPLNEMGNKFKLKHIDISTLPLGNRIPNECKQQTPIYA